MSIAVIIAASVFGIIALALVAKILTAWFFRLNEFMEKLNKIISLLEKDRPTP